ncbi:protein of unknown function [Micromonospora pattaloongensis]|uniref:DUF397 domain-containing protein n=1 Tax=Micromonospora pattaloongensis TaxID=405436 RepID=A0A1H3NXN1_9ACTN|nr:DUF397 domain-containing protein [Micromonospora pattaloongensis]SDY93588.1 protein of unknown function [Micromonospora pattaloongensis]
MDLSRANWRKSTRSNANGACVEVADLDAAVAVRDSKDRNGPVLVFAPGRFTTFVAALKDRTLVG